MTLSEFDNFIDEQVKKPEFLKGLINHIGPSYYDIGVVRKPQPSLSVLAILNLVIKDCSEEDDILGFIQALSLGKFSSENDALVLFASTYSISAMVFHNRQEFIKAQAQERVLLHLQQTAGYIFQQITEKTEKK